MELRRYLALLRQRMLLVAVTVVAGLAGGYVVGRHAPTYQSQTSIYVAFPLPSGQSSTDILQIDQVLATYAALVRSSPVADGAVQASHAARTAAKVIGETSSTVIPSTNLILVTVSDRDRSIAQSLANGMAASFIAQAHTLAAAYGVGNSTGTPSVTVVQPAGLPGAPLPTALKRDVALGGFFGLTASVALVLLVDYLDLTIKTVEDLGNDRDLTVLGTIGWARPGTAGTQPFQDAYRVVRSNLLASLADIKSPRVVVVTSAHAGEGKSVVCSNLAESFARLGQRIAVVDLNLRHPDIHRLLGAENSFGVTDVLLGRRTLDDSIQYLPLPNPDPQSAKEFLFLGTGPPVPNPTELLGSPGTTEMLEQLGEQTDLILIDAPPVLPGADMLVIGPIVSGVVLVVEARRTTSSDFAQSRDLLARNHTKLFGVVLNKLKNRAGGAR